ncbi:MAG: rRNA maturation RNase YbeY [Candidatus Schekmanbacteria bacterium RBG_13_48_7]|uniref:Endoribonuclease YbeY n=1 Tax=Candidatus Schekmanbacteria bacterium RBG_13_48_7 TaxID=1817878 RepID=A0A1F7RVA2_9BACT|nr:MAG: rRNA maturation RNase YbeY [Candidatus Schekmanbacteria bacterium RBG_13_48_7]
MKLWVRREAKIYTWPKKRVKQLFEQTRLCTMIPVNSEISVKFVDDKTMTLMNKIYRNMSQTTDVLAFAMLEEKGKPFDPAEVQSIFLDHKNSPDIPLYLGDILISVDQAKKQAFEVGNHLNKEIALLLIHGLLHLIGYDDTIDTNKTRMWEFQNYLLDNSKHIWKSASTTMKGE